MAMGVLLKISFIVLAGCRSRETAFLCMSDFECLHDNVVFFEGASGYAMHMHERGAVVSDGSKAILVREAQKAVEGFTLPSIASM